ncbi:MAG TPA: DNA repair protein RecO [Gammaproteobacteria bacterium]|nr:DNA repair protein RecO [Gammaproteobacteria bacterium]
MTDREHVLLERAYILHQRSYRNSSQLLECLAETHGRVSLVAQGSRRAANGQRAVLQPFLPLRISWVRRGELGRLTHVELEQPAALLPGKALLAGYYLNELLLRLLARGDPNAAIFSSYVNCLAELASSATVARALRLFEMHLLRALGYGIELDRDVDTGEPLEPEQCYRVEAERGVYLHRGTAVDADTYLGRDLIALREGSLQDEQALRSAQRLLSGLLDVYLGDRPLKTRAVMRDIVGRGLAP